MRGLSRHAVARYRRRPRMRAEKRAAQRRGYTAGAAGTAALPGGRASAPHSVAATPITFRHEHPPGGRTASAAEINRIQKSLFIRVRIQDHMTAWCFL